jgi:segregation and condensation protein A
MTWPCNALMVTQSKIVHDPRVTSYMVLMEACLVVLRGREGRPETEPIYRPVIAELWRVSDALARIRALLPDHP